LQVLTPQFFSAANSCHVFLTGAALPANSLPVKKEKLISSGSFAIFLFYRQDLLLLFFIAR